MQDRPRAAELARFCAVGASGYAVNVATFAVASLALGFYAAFAAAFLVSASTNFVLHRAWTFRARAGRKRRQYPRFVLVGAAALSAQLLAASVLLALAHLGDLPTAGLAVALATPVSFLAQRTFTFRRAAPAALPVPAVPPLRLPAPAVHVVRLELPLGAAPIAAPVE